MRSRVAAMLPPGSPATITTRTLLSASARARRRPRASAATSASRSAYVGVQHTTVGFDRLDHRQPQLARHAAARHAVRADLTAGFERAPEAEERAERKRKEDAIRRRHARARGTRPSSSRASTASSRWCRSTSADGRSSTRCGSSACSSRSARSAPCPTARALPDPRSAPPSSSAAAARDPRASAATRAPKRDARGIELARVERVAAVDVDQELAEPLRLPRASACRDRPFRATARPHSIVIARVPRRLSGRGEARRDLRGNVHRLHRLVRLVAHADHGHRCRSPA